jgi:hypothetical protein
VETCPSEDITRPVPLALAVHPELLSDEERALAIASSELMDYGITNGWLLKANNSSENFVDFLYPKVLRIESNKKYKRAAQTVNALISPTSGRMLIRTGPVTLHLDKFYRLMAMNAALRHQTTKAEHPRHQGAKLLWRRGHIYRFVSRCDRHVTEHSALEISWR